MKTKQKSNLHLVFWQTLAKDAQDKVPIQNSLAKLAKKLDDTPLGKAVAQIQKAVCGGDPLANAMRLHPAIFPAVLVTLVRVGEATGMLDIVLTRINDGFGKDMFATPGHGADPSTDEVRFWQILHLMLSCGVPVLSSLEAVRDSMAGKPLREASAKLIEGIAQGKTLSAGMRECPEAFNKEVCDIIEASERAGKVDEAAQRLAQALETGDLAAVRAAFAPPETIENAEFAPVIRIANMLLVEALRQRASDIHLDLTANQKVCVRFRIDGVLKEIPPFPEALWPQVVSRFKIMANMDLAQHRLPQDGRIQIKALGKQVDLRVSVAPTVSGERIVLRILDPACLPSGIGYLGLEPDDQEKILGLIHQPNGIVICSGPTGSGKTTLLYAALQELNRKENCVMSVEDPVEYIVDGVAQIQVKTAEGLTFSRAMRTILRQDPDVILVGEIRDLETLQVSVHAALTGHLILTTMHATDAVDTVKRMVDIGVDPFLVNSSLTGVIAQRLFRKLCPKCKQPYDLPRNQLPPGVLAILAKNPNATFYRPQGCEACHKGYKGRGAIHEILVMNEPVRRLLGPSLDIGEIRRVARQNGMQTLLESGMVKAIKGLTSIEQVLGIVPAE